MIRIYNYVRCVRGGVAEPRTNGPEIEVRQTLLLSRNGRQQPPARGQRRGNVSFYEDLIRRLDRNRDGKISRSEFDGPQDQFRIWDRNKDGFLSEDEVPLNPPPRRGDRRF